MRKFPQGVLPSDVDPATRKRPSDTKQHSEARGKFRMGLNGVAGVSLNVLAIR